MKTWRLIIDDNVSAAFGLAADEAITRRIGRGESPPTLRLYTYRPHCALVGRFQNIDNEIQLDFCRQNDVQVNRRPTGGGAIIMGSEQLGVALMVPSNLSLIPSREERGWVSRQQEWAVRGKDAAHFDKSIGNTRALMRRFSAGLVAALNQLGIAAAFQRKNDLEVDSKKIAGLGVYRDPSGGLLFHASLLVDLDIALMLKILKTPFEKISDKEIGTVASRITTVRTETGKQLSLDEVRWQIAEGYADVFDVALEQQDFSDEERVDIAQLKREKYCTHEWIFQTTAVPDSTGSARKKTPAGLLDVRVAMAGRIIKALYLCGDFFVAENTIADIEAHLKWHSSEPDDIEKTLQTVHRKHAVELEGMPMRALKSVILAAVENASAQKMQPKQSYGCFIKPDAMVA